MNNKKRMILAVTVLLLFLMSALSGCGKTYTVTFDLNGGELVSGETVQSVKEGASAIAPEATNGRQELSWDQDFTNVKSDMTVTAQWNKVEMNSTDLAEYVQQRTVTVNVDTVDGSSVSGSGFFIDDQGTIITNNHVINGATSMSVEVSDGGNYPVQTIVDFSEVYDLAILKIDITDNPYLEISTDEVKTGEQVYAVGSALGTLTGSFTGGTVSSASRTVGLINCIQMDAAISSGNSGGPLVDIYGDVVGINTYSYSGGENLNLAIKPSTLDVLSRDKNYTVNDYKEWYATETARSYSPFDGTNYYYSTVNTYQVVTGASCVYSVDSSGNLSDGYYDCNQVYIYNYVVSEYDSYVAYLKSIGFVYQDNDVSDSGTAYYYMNETSGVMVDLVVSSDNTALAVQVYE